MIDGVNRLLNLLNCSLNDRWQALSLLVERN
jgi:hypothetical protein